jgi:cytidine deaminase
MHVYRSSVATHALRHELRDVDLLVVAFLLTFRARRRRPGGCLILLRTEMTPEQQQQLVAAAREVRANAYAPASKFLVGAALLTDDGRVFVGCNVENASYGLTICAERAAVCAAVAAGARRVVAVAVVTGLADPARPCGACRQVLSEFGPDMQVVLAGTGESELTTTLAKLLPDAFSFDALEP